ncbi:MAG: DUF4173 domain-containing protein [bacterium]|nr:DUF4173 domain-containing protein [bacterium]
MTRTKIIKIVLLLTGGILFNLLFWEENMGINLLLFSTFLIAIGLMTQGILFASKGIWVSIAGVLLTGIMVVYHHSLAARIIHIISLIVFTGFLCEPQLKAVFNAILASLLNVIDLPKHVTLELFQGGSNNVKFQRRWRWIKLIVIPIAAFWLFYIIFYASNPVFSELSDRFWGSIGDFFMTIFKDFSLFWMIQFIVGMSIVGLIVLRSKSNRVQLLEDKFGDTIVRRRSKKESIFRLRKLTMISLLNEYKSALLLVGSINALLLVVNAIDIHWIWFNFEYNGTANLSQLVHEGTYLLILSILLSMGILLYFFRRNINFLPENIWLRRLSNAWIIQNAILMISVVIRNYHYMYHFGLAYKRIGVMFFLTAVIIGLITLYIKINKKKTSFYLLRVNSWAVYFLLLILSSVNWDMVIVRHNIEYTHEKNLDVSFLLSLSDKTLPVIHKNRAKLNLGRDHNYRPITYEQQLDDRIEDFNRMYKNLSWKSWNYHDQKAHQFFTSLDKN